MLRTGVVVVRRTTRVSLSSSSMAWAVSEIATANAAPGRNTGDKVAGTPRRLARSARPNQ